MVSDFKVRIALLLLPAFFLLSSSAYAVSDVQEEGYDENTEIAIRGVVKEVVGGAKGPVVLKLQAAGKVYYVIIGPPWYLAQEGIVFTAGSEWEINGAKYFGRDGNLYIVGRCLKSFPGGRTIILRDSFCRPLWMDHGMRHMHRRKQGG